MHGMIPVPNLPLDPQTPQRLLAYFDSIGALLWDSNQKRSFAMYALGLLSPLKRKSVEPIAAHFTSDVDQADAIHQRLLNFLTDAPWPDEAVRFLLYHGENDAEHIEEFKAMLAMVLPDEAASRRIVRTAEVTARLYALQIEEILA